MNRSVFEGRFLINMLGGLIRQDESFPVHRRMNWERLFRISDYHNIASAIYLSMLGATERVPEMWGERFFLRYQEAVRYSEGYESAETEILSTFNAMKLTATVLQSSAIRRLYPVLETSDNSPLRLYVSEESYTLARGYLLDLGYETDIFYKGFGEHMRRRFGGGFRVELYRRLPFISKGYKKNMKSLLDRAYPDKQLKYIRMLSLESSYVFRIAETVYNYCRDELRIRELLDIYLFYKLFHKSMNRKFIDARLREFGISVQSISLLHIADMWFGDRREPLFPAPKEDMSIYDGIESRILSNGMVGQDGMAEAQRLRKEIYDAQHREERAEKRRRALDSLRNAGKAVRRVFPDRKYMAALYPVLERHPVLTPLFWIKRIGKLILLELRIRKPDRQSRESVEENQEMESGRSLSFGESSESLSPYMLPPGGRRRKKVFWKPHEHSQAGTETREDESAEEETRVTGSSISPLGIPMDISKDSVFHSEEISENDEPEDSEEELKLWEFPRLNQETETVFRAESGREADIVFREHKDVAEEEIDDRLLSSDDVPRIKFTSYQAVSSIGEMEIGRVDAEDEPVEEKGTGTVDGREVEFSKWKFPKVDDI